MNWPSSTLKHELLVMMRLPGTLNYDDLPEQYRAHASAVGKDAGPGATSWTQLDPEMDGRSGGGGRRGRHHGNYRSDDGYNPSPDGW